MQKILEIITYAHAQIGPVTQLPAGGAGSLNTLIANLVDWILWLGGGIAVIYVIYGGFMYLTAGPNEEQTKTARSIIINSIIGVVIIAFSIIIVRWTISAIDFTSAPHF